jgi:hypothetical protein
MSLRDVAITLKVSSPGVSPNVFVADFPAEHSSKRRKQNVFFNDSLSIEELRKLGNVDPIQEVDESDAEVRRKLPISSGKSPMPILASKNDLASKAQLTPPPPGFQATPTKPELKKRILWADLSSDSSCTPTPRPLRLFNVDIGVLSEAIKPEPLVLQEPPKKNSLHKRMERCQYKIEAVVETRKQGTLKFYNLRKRFGFVTLVEDSSEVFICEDDILLSGQNLKQFKDAVAKRHPVLILCDVKSYESKGELKLKAVNVEVRIEGDVGRLA